MGGSAPEPPIEWRTIWVAEAAGLGVGTKFLMPVDTRTFLLSDSSTEVI
jgi:hypothetical protein